MILRTPSTRTTILATLLFVFFLIGLSFLLPSSSKSCLATLKKNQTALTYQKNSLGTEHLIASGCISSLSLEKHKNNYDLFGYFKFLDSNQKIRGIKIKFGQNDSNNSKVTGYCLNDLDLKQVGCKLVNLNELKSILSYERPFGVSIPIDDQKLFSSDEIETYQKLKASTASNVLIFPNDLRSITFQVNEVFDQKSASVAPPTYVKK